MALTVERVTSGPTDRRVILALAIPALGALVAEPLFLLADSAIVGRLGTVPLAGLGIAAAVLAAVVSAFVFLAYGTTASVARRIGAGDQDGALRQGIDGLWLAAGLGASSSPSWASSWHRPSWPPSAPSRRSPIRRSRTCAGPCPGCRPCSWCSLRRGFCGVCSTRAHRSRSRPRARS